MFSENRRQGSLEKITIRLVRAHPEFFFDDLAFRREARAVDCQKGHPL